MFNGQISYMRVAIQLLFKFGSSSTRAIGITSSEEPGVVYFAKIQPRFRIYLVKLEPKAFTFATSRNPFQKHSWSHGNHPRVCPAQGHRGLLARVQNY